MNMSLLVELSTLFGIKGNPGRSPSVIVVDEDLFLQAIQEYGPVVVSQAKWLFIAKAVASFNSFVSDGAHKTCAMCVVHYRPHAAYGQECALCPIYKESGFDSCIGTPYEGYQMADDVVTMRTMAMNEVDFLERFIEPPKYSWALTLEDESGRWTIHVYRDDKKIATIPDYSISRIDAEYLAKKIVVAQYKEWNEVW